MLITIITVVYNGNSTIKTLLQSVRNFKLDVNSEYIVIDGQSDDGTIQTLKENSDIIDLLVSEPDAGIYDAMNKALNYATGDYCIFMGADDELLVDNLKYLVNKIKDPDSVYYGSVIKEGNILGCKTNFWKILRENIPHQAVLYPKILYKSRQYKTKYRICADHELNIWAYYNGFKFTYFPIIVAEFGAAGCSSTFEDYAFKSDYLTIVKENAGTVIELIIKSGKSIKCFIDR